MEGIGKIYIELGSRHFSVRYCEHSAQLTVEGVQAQGERDNHVDWWAYIFVDRAVRVVVTIPAAIIDVSGAGWSRPEARGQRKVCKVQGVLDQLDQLDGM